MKNKKGKAIISIALTAIMAASVLIVSAEVIFDVPYSATIGDEIVIMGTISAGDEVDILVDDGDVAYFDDVPVDEDNEFEVKWNTEGLQTGSYTIDAYIDCPYDSYEEIEAAGIEEDGKTTIQLIVPVLVAEQPRNVTAEGDDYIFQGIATGVDEVDYILVGPEGWKSEFSTPSILAGILIGSTATVDNAFQEDITMAEGLDMGMWKVLILAPGRDGMYATGEKAGELSLAALGVTAGKNQSQIVAVIEDVLLSGGSDDLMAMLTFEVAIPYVRLNPIDAVTVGEPLEISGVTNREPGTKVVIWATEEPAKSANASIPRVGAHADGVQAAFVRDARTVNDTGSTYADNPTVSKGELVNPACGGTRTRTQEIAVNVDYSEQVVGNDVLITTVSSPGVQVVVNIQAGHATFYTNKGDWSSRADNTTGNLSNTNFIGTMPADGTLELVITSATNGVVTIRAGIDANANGCIDYGELTDTVCVCFVKSQTIVETSTTTITIGNMATIFGFTTAGVNQFAIFVDNVLQQIASVEAGYFEWDWDTSLGLVVGNTSGVPLKSGLVTIKVFEIHPVDVPGVIGDGLDTRCGGDGATPGGGTSTFYDIFTGQPRHADAYTWILAVDNVSTPLFPPVITVVEWPTANTGVFNATIDTANAIPGTYTIEVRDGNGNSDTTTVEIRAAIPIFDTGSPVNPYPSISGTHNGTIKPNHTIIATKLFTYPCPGTGGHTEYARIWNYTWNATATWKGYAGDWHNISFNKTFTLVKDHEYNYTIRTGSYPQIIHARSKPVTGGLINCTEFTDANGKIYDNWIPAIRLYHN